MYQISQGRVTFTRGTKPLSIKQRQREVRDVYTYLSRAGASRIGAVAKGMYLEEGTAGYSETILKHTPAHMNAIDTAVAAYVATGASLMQNTKMYSMDLHVPLSSLDLYKDLPADLVEALRALNSPTIIFQAREI